MTANWRWSYARVSETIHGDTRTSECLHHSVEAFIGFETFCLVHARRAYYASKSTFNAFRTRKLGTNNHSTGHCHRYMAREIHSRKPAASQYIERAALLVVTN